MEMVSLVTHPLSRIRLGVLEVQIILGTFLAELRCCHVHTDLDLARVTGLLYGLLQEVQTYKTKAEILNSQNFQTHGLLLSPLGVSSVPEGGREGM